MTATCNRPRHDSSRWNLALPKRSPRTPVWRSGWIYGLVFLLLGGYLLFAHGCHGDEDNELFANLKSLVEQPAQ
jgi:hypothetical protein